MAKQKTLLVVTSQGDKYFQQMVKIGYANLPWNQRVEFNILDDLIYRGGRAEMSDFLTEGRDTILGRTFSRLSERVQGQLAIEGYGKTLHQLIKQDYIKAFRQEVAATKEG